MSLDFFLESDEARVVIADEEPVTVEGSGTTHVVHYGNITHDLIEMATEAGLYRCLWRPDEEGIGIAAEMIPPLEAGLRVLRSDPERFRCLDPPNDWGTHETLLRFAEEVLAACRANPTAWVCVCR